MIKFLKSHNTVYLLVFSVFCSSLILTRVFMEEESTYLFLIKNMALAWIPFLLSQFFRVKTLSKPLLILCLLLWLLFFPNTLYTTTDLIYIYRKPKLRVWFDIILLLSYVLLALFLAFASLKNFEDLLLRKFTKAKATILVFLALYAGSIGVYLGRYKRLNSSDLFTQPSHLFKEVFDVLTHPFDDANFYIITFVFTLFSYLIYYGVFHFAKNH